MTDQEKKNANRIYTACKAAIIKHTQALEEYVKVIADWEKLNLDDATNKKISKKLDPYADKLNEVLDKLN